MRQRRTAGFPQENRSSGRSSGMGLFFSVCNKDAVAAGVFANAAAECVYRSCDSVQV